jgi:hypothetical protein
MTDLVGLPDARIGRRKAHFRQLRDLYADILGTELRGRSNTALRAGVSGGPLGLAEATSSRVGWEVTKFDPRHPAWPPYHALAWFFAGDDTVGGRRNQLRDLLAALRPASLLVVVGSVVVDESSPTAPSISSLISELSLASGGALYAEDLRSLRWPGEQVVRGVCLTLRYLGTGR